MTGKELQAMRAKLNLTQPQVAQLVHMTVYPKNFALSISRWENGHGQIPDVTAEMLRTKFYLLENQLATYEHLVQYPLHVILSDLFS